LCRFWQLAIGGILVSNAFKINQTLYAHILSVVGLLTIVITSFFFTADFYPGCKALFPTLEAAALIQSGSDAIINKYILSNKTLGFIGKISYSLYLWHVPLIYFFEKLYP
jgi:peptidoglycan/LPS O-acetylase OafA/YrhL